MKKIILPLFTLYCVSFLLYTGNGLFLTSAGLKLYDIGIDTMLIGIVNASFFLGIAVGSIFAVSVLQKVGHIRSYCFFGSVYTLGILAHILSDNIYLWMIFRLLLGLGTSGLLMIIESWLNEKSDTSNRSRVLSFYSLTFYFSYLLGVYLLSYNLSLMNIFIISAIFSLFSLIPVSLTKIKEPSIPPVKRVSFPNLFSIVPLALLGSFIAGLVINGFFTMSSIYVLKLGFGAKEVSIFLACAIAGGFVIQIPMGKFSDTYGRRNAIMLSSSLAFISSCLLFIYTHNLLMQYISSFILGSGIFTFYSLSLARANDVLDNPSDIVEVNRGLLLSYGIASLLSPIILGFLLVSFSSYGFITLFIVSSLVLFIFALTKDSIPLEDRTVYVPIVGDTGALAANMDVREENNAQEIEELQKSQ